MEVLVKGIVGEPRVGVIDSGVASKRRECDFCGLPPDSINEEPPCVHRYSAGEVEMGGGELLDEEIRRVVNKRLGELPLMVSCRGCVDLNNDRVGREMLYVGLLMVEDPPR